MAANTKTCAKCGGPLAPVSNKPGRRACLACGRGFSVRDRKADAPASAGGDPRLRTALLVAGGGAVVLLGLIAAIAFVVVHRAGGAAPPKPVAAAPSTPAPDPSPTPRPTLPPAPDPIATPPPPTTVSASPPDPVVTKAIDKGVAYLKSAVNRVPLGPVTNGGSSGGTGIFSLVGLALLESGVPADDPAVVKAVAAARSGGAAANATYEIATCLWLLDHVNDRRDDGLMRDLATRLIAGQNQSGAWGYLCPILTPAQQKELLAVLNAYDPSMEIPDKQTKQLFPACAYRRGLSLQSDAGDNSVTQFAVLGLWVARKHQVPVDRSLLMAEAHARATQKDEGGWAYSPGPPWKATDAMTCAGLMELAVGRGVSVTEGGKVRDADPQFEKGIWYLSDIYDRGVGGRGATLQHLAADLLGHALQGQRAAWKTDLAAFQAELERCLAADPPADAKKDMQQIADQIKQYRDAPGDLVTQEKAALVKQIQQSAAGRAAAAAAAGPGMAPGRFLLPNRDQGTNIDDIYALWSLERLAMVCKLKTLAGHDWYAWGADLLVTHQRDDGGWTSPGIVPEPVNACLALLFLKRVNVAPDLTAQLQRIAPVQDLTADQLHYTSAEQFRLSGPTAPAKPSGP